MKALIPRHILPGLDMAPFKLTCDEFQPTNTIVNNQQDLKVVAVIDWEWSYTAPAQLVRTTPPWLWIQSPNARASVDGRLARFNKHLELYTRLLKEEGLKILGEDIAEHHKPRPCCVRARKMGASGFTSSSCVVSMGPRLSLRKASGRD